MFHVPAQRAAALLLLACSTAPQALERLPVLDLDTARRMAGACEALATQKGWRMNIAVVDAGANLLVFARMDRAFLGSGEIAIGKAAFSARFPFSTRFAEELAYGKGGKAPAVPGLAQTPGVVAFAGGLPVMAGTVQVGGIGVSGGSPDEDEQCAAAGLAAVKPALD
jgi:glc operon protein GlcG